MIIFNVVLMILTVLKHITVVIIASSKILICLPAFMMLILSLRYSKWLICPRSTVLLNYQLCRSPNTEREREKKTNCEQFYVKIKKTRNLVVFVCRVHMCDVRQNILFASWEQQWTGSFSISITNKCTQNINWISAIAHISFKFISFAMLFTVQNNLGI